MLKDGLIFPSIRVGDLAQARAFYEGKLGLEVIYDQPGELLLKAAKNSRIYLYQGKPSVAEHTVAYFYISNLDEVMSQLRAKGVSFEQYPDLGTDENGVAADKAGIRYAWFKDPEGHILCLAQIK